MRELLNLWLANLYSVFGICYTHTFFSFGTSVCTDLPMYTAVSFLTRIYLVQHLIRTYLEWPNLWFSSAASRLAEINKSHFHLNTSSVHRQMKYRFIISLSVNPFELQVRHDQQFIFNYEQDLDGAVNKDKKAFSLTAPRHSQGLSKDKFYISELDQLQVVCFCHLVAVSNGFWQGFCFMPCGSHNACQNQYHPLRHTLVSKGLRTILEFSTSSLISKANIKKKVNKGRKHIPYCICI